MRFLALLSFAIAILGATSAMAGKADPRSLAINTTTAPFYAHGSLAKVRSSGANKEVIACSADSDGLIKCHATNADGTKTVSCTSTTPVFLSVVRMINRTSYLHFEWNSSNQCTRIRVYDGSQFLP